MSLKAEIVALVPYARWKHHGSHLLLGLAIVSLFLAFGADWLTATLWGVVIAPLCIELAQWQRWFDFKKPTTAYARDIVADLVTYQGGWLVFCVHERAWGAFAVLAALLALLYLALIKWMRP